MTAQNGQKVFGAGRFYGVSIGANPTPAPFILTQKMSLDFKRDIKRIYGMRQLPADVASGTLAVTGAADMGTLSSRVVNDLMLTGTVAGGQTAWIDKESGTIPGTPYQVTVANSGTWTVDLGVIAVATGIPMVRVASAPATGQYSVASGVYTFAAADTTLAVVISYLYTIPSTGQTLTMANKDMGKIGNFQSIMTMLWGSEKATVQLYNCMMGGFSLATQLDDYTKPALNFEAACDASDNLGIFSFAETN